MPQVPFLADEQFAAVLRDDGTLVGHGLLTDSSSSDTGKSKIKYHTFFLFQLHVNYSG